MTTLDMLITSRTNLVAAYLDSSANPKPNYTIDGETYAWSDFRAKLLDEIKGLDTLIAREDPDQLNFEIEVKGV